VKTIGDAVMLVAPEPGPLVGCALDLVGAAEEAELPPLRAGVAYGPAVNRWGDWYGTTVNLASRLTERARPGTVLVEAAAQEAVDGDGFEWSFAGEKKLKGFSVPAKAFRAKRP
jgi:adenylate cyclase